VTARDGAQLVVLGVQANPGWVPEVEQGSGAEVEVQFRNGTARVDVDAELEDGAAGRRTDGVRGGEHDRAGLDLAERQPQLPGDDA